MYSWVCFNYCQIYLGQKVKVLDFIQTSTPSSKLGHRQYMNNKQTDIFKTESCLWHHRGGSCVSSSNKTHCVMTQ